MFIIFVFRKCCLFLFKVIKLKKKKVIVMIFCSDNEVYSLEIENDDVGFGIKVDGIENVLEDDDFNNKMKVKNLENLFDNNYFLLFYWV